MLKVLIIAAISARCFAQAAARQGYQVIVLDAFIDADTKRVAHQCLQVNMTGEGVDQEDFKRQFKKIKLDASCAFVYGSLFDSLPDLLAWVAKRVIIVGNLPQTFQLARSFDFFAQLDALNIRHPQVQLSAPKRLESWLAKRTHSTGGAQVRWAQENVQADYFQQKIEGVPVSLLFLANKKWIKVVGVNQQFLAPVVEMPYRFAGALGNISLPAKAQEVFVEAAQKLTLALELRGLNSLDAVLEGDCLWILELNPRLSATFELYDNLLDAHIKACAGELVEVARQGGAKAKFILYADEQIRIASQFDWPSWVADIPSTESGDVMIKAGAPVCTVLAEGEDSLAAHQLLLARIHQLKKVLL